MSIENPYDPDERRIEAMMDGSGFSRESAEIRVGKKVVGGTSETPSARKPARRKSRSQPLETSGQMASHDLAVQHAKEHPYDPSVHPEINRRGRALAGKAFDEFMKTRET